MRTLVAVAAALVAAMVMAPRMAAAQQAAAPWFDEAKLSQPTFKVISRFDVQVPMRDGVRLSANVFRPDAAGKFPTLLWRTPYGKNGDVDEAKWYAQRGYVVVMQDVRGKYDSGGEYVPFAQELADGYDTDEWIGHQPWSNGRIGGMGGSYLGYTQIAEGVAGSRYLKDLAATVTTSDVANNWVYIDGALFLGFAYPWGGVEMQGHVMQNGRVYDWPSLYRHLPLATLDEAAGRVNPTFRAWLQHPRANDPYWNGISLENRVQDIKVPFLDIDGWFNLFLRGALDDQVKIRRHGATELARSGRHIVIGPWAHETGIRNNSPDSPATGPNRSIDFGPELPIDKMKIFLRWQDHWLKGIANGVEHDAPVKIFVMGKDYWRDEYEWPLARTVYTNYYLAGSHANSAAGDGLLTTTVPGPAAVATDRYVYDPADPVPTLGGSTCCSSVPHGPWDERVDEIRRDVLVYQTPVLTKPVEVTGPIVMQLYASTSARDTDWTAKLVDVYPDGYAENLQDGIIRARYRNGKDAPASLLTPGRVYEYTIDMWATSNVFLPGHRIRLEISSSNFPRFDRNLNTGEDPMTGTRMVKADQTIYHSAQYPSHLVLPIIPIGSKPDPHD